MIDNGYYIHKEYVESAIAAVGFELGYTPSEIMELECQYDNPYGLFWWAEQITKRNKQ
jgi:hypothetical protein